jgi:hypothetical protein
MQEKSYRARFESMERLRAADLSAEARADLEARDAFTFSLQNSLAPHKPATFASNAATQRKLLDGLDCLPGQQDLF